MKSVIAVVWVAAGVMRASADPVPCANQVKRVSDEVPLVVAYTSGTWIRDPHGAPDVALWADGTIAYTVRDTLELRQGAVAPSEASRVANHVVAAIQLSPPERAFKGSDAVTVEMLARDDNGWVRARVYGADHPDRGSTAAAEYAKAFAELRALVPPDTKPYVPAEVEVRLSAAGTRAAKQWPRSVPAIPAKAPAGVPPAEYAFVVPGKHWAALVHAFDPDKPLDNTVPWRGGAWWIHLRVQLQGQATIDLVRGCRR